MFSDEHTDKSAENVTEDAFRYVHDEGFWQVLRQEGMALLCTTYQAGKLILLRAGEERVSALFRTFDWATGLAVTSNRLALGTQNKIWFLRNELELAAGLPPPGLHDACFVPRSCHVTGDVRVHELAWCNEDLWLVNTRFSCLCTLNDHYSFVPRWKPPYISELAAEDRCHLNGLCVVDGQPRYVTALGLTDTPQGWRPDKARGGVLLDVPSGEVVAAQLCMPHSPRVHQEKLWFLNSGLGELQVVDIRSGATETVAQLPGYVRGLAFCGNYAFVGLSRIREKREFGGLPIESTCRDLKCGIHVLDVPSGRTIGVLEFERTCEEIFDVQVLAEIKYPAVVGFKKNTIDGVFVYPRITNGIPGQRELPTGNADDVWNSYGQDK